ncbi:MAG: 2-(1,2-epoxy-1,2-dihydrophenyl)acetyl-CoA isomerase [Gammaproteobacteria bacterium]|jgi:2-(1,2-epoxy-1,2-dihydrophenyl)acetyl-CoA isomerase
MSEYETITFEQRDAVARICLNRPEAANGLNRLMGDELNQAARICDSTPSIKVVQLTATGRFFSAGGDIREFAEQGETIGREIKGLADSLHSTIATFRRMDAALVIAVNGIAAGAGFSMAIAGDIVLAGRSASFTMAYTRAGLSPDGSSSYFLPRLVGLRKAQELMLLNTTLTAEEAAECGLITAMVDDDDLMQEVEKIIDNLSQASLPSTAAVKGLLLASSGNSLETQMELEGRALAKCASGDDGQEGIKAFLGKRQPSFK